MDAGGLRDAAQQVLGSLLDIGRGRIELATVELEEQRLHVARLFIAAAVTLFFGFVALVVLSAWIVMLCEPVDRALALGVLSALYVAATAAGAWTWHRLSTHKPPLLQATLAELRSDRAALHSRGTGP